MSDATSIQSPWMTREEAAEYARVTPQTLEQAVEAGELRCRRVGRRVLFHRDWVDAWLEAVEEQTA